MYFELIQNLDLGNGFGALHLLARSYLDKTELSCQWGADDQVLHAFLGAVVFLPFTFQVILHQLTAEDGGSAVVAQTFQLQGGALRFIFEFIPLYFQLSLALYTHAELLFIEGEALFQAVEFIGCL